MKRIVLFLGLLLSITFVVGCNNTPKNVAENQPTQTVTSQGNTDAANNISSTKEVADFEKYKGDWKLKVEGNEELYLITSLEEYFGLTGINIAEINNGTVKGTIYSIQGAPSHRQAEVDFTGNIEDAKLRASYKDEGWLYSGKIELTFGKDMIKANITRDKVDPTPMWGIPEGNFTFVKPIETEKVNLTDQVKVNLEKFLFPTAKDRLKPFAEGSLTDEMMINYVGYNLALGFIDTSEFGDKVQNKDDITFDKSVMNELTRKYFGVEVKNHKTVDITVYKDGKYTLLALGGVSEYPQVQLLLQDNQNKEIYYAMVDYMSENPQDGQKLEYQRFIKLKKNASSYTIKAIKEMESPISFQ